MPLAASHLRRARIGIFGCFATSGFVMGAWPASFPATDARLGLGEARLGTALLVLELCCLTAMLAAGRLCDRVTSRKVLRWSAPVAQLLLIAPALAPSYPALLGCVTLYGVGLGFVNVALNVQSVELERHHGRPIISSFHAFWSLGAAAAGALTVVALGIGVDSRAILIGTGLVAATVIARFTRPLLPPPDRASTDVRTGGAPLRLGFGLLAFAAVIAFSIDFVEAGAVGWANLHAAHVLGAGETLAPLALTAFLVAMTLFRLVGDPIRARLGAQRSLLYAGIVTVAGFAFVLTSAAFGGLAVAWAGWIFAGAGSAILVPVLFSAVGEAGGTSANLAAVSVCGSAAFLLCPAIVGHLAEATSLTVGLVIPTVLAVVIVLAGPVAVTRLRRHAPESESALVK